MAIADIKAIDECFEGSLSNTIEAIKQFESMEQRAETIRGINRNEEPMKLDMEAIRKRLGEAVVVEFGTGGYIGILIPLSSDKGYVNLDTGNIWKTPDGGADGITPSNWLIRPGDKCQMSDNGVKWFDKIYNRFAPGENSYQFIASDGEDWQFIRPVKLTATQVQIQKLEKELKVLKELEGVE